MRVLIEFEGEELLMMTPGNTVTIKNIKRISQVKGMALAPTCKECGGTGISPYTGHKTWCGSCTGTGIEGVKTDKITKGKQQSPNLIFLEKKEYYGGEENCMESGT